MVDLRHPLLTTDDLASYYFRYSQKSLTEKNIDICPICLISPSVHLINLCQHSFCDSCLVSYLEIKISESQVNNLPCPKCSIDIPESFIESILSEKSFKKFKDYQRIKQLELDIFVKFCPVADCKGFDIASEINIKLTCNECAHKYCYYCSQKWHEGKCKDNTELSFKLWAYANNLKICPRCKNHVQKNGGCPHMTCPRCNFNWCWKCGKSTLSSSHNEFNCMIGKHWYDIYWTIILLLLLFPIISPFLIFLSFFLLFYPQNNTSILSKIYNTLWSRLIFYLLLLCLSPIIEVLLAIWGLILIFLFFTYNITKKSYWFCIFGMILGFIVASLSVCAGVLIFTLAPFFGLFFLILKIFYLCKISTRKHKNSIKYRRSLV